MKQARADLQPAGDPHPPDTADAGPSTGIETNVTDLDSHKGDETPKRATEILSERSMRGLGRHLARVSARY